MFKSNSNFKSNIQKSTSKTLRNIKLYNTMNTNNISRLGMISLSICLVIYLSLPCKAQLQLHNIIQHPLVIVFLSVLCLLVGYANIVIGISLLLFLAILYLNNHKKYNKVCFNNNSNSNNNLNNIQEGFKDSFMDDFKKKENKMEDGIKDMFEPGPFRKGMQEAENNQDDLFNKEMARNNMLMLEAIKSKKKKRSNSRNNKGEGFNNTSSGKGNKKEKFTSIAMRKFNPNNKEDTNLLLVIELCDDIKDRIKYDYESVKYTKRYIKDKLEEIIDLLELVEEDI